MNRSWLPVTADGKSWNRSGVKNFYQIPAIADKAVILCQKPVHVTEDNPEVSTAMSFTGDLEHLPIVDVIQLMHSTRKSGTLVIKCPKGESQLVFKDGYIASANHLNNSIRIGQILVDSGIVDNTELTSALKIQESAGDDRKPLIATLMEMGKINKEEAFKCLETLIERTIVEILTWSKGTFALDVTRTLISDEYRYFPESLQQEINLDTQSVLMDALRIFDEQMRDGIIEVQEFLDEAAAASGTAQPAIPASKKSGISADDLGLADLDLLDRKIPDVYLGVKESKPVESYIRKLNTFAGELQQHQLPGKLIGAVKELQKLETPPDISFVLLQFISLICERTLTLVVGQGRLNPERGVGIKTERSHGPKPVTGFHIPLTPGSIFSKTVDEGHVYYGKCEDAVMQDQLYAAVGAPLRSTVLLVPVQWRGKTIALIYGDFGSREISPVPLDHIELLATQAGIALDIASFRKGAATKAPH